MIRIGVICPSEIAFRRFMPALSKNRDFLFVGIGVPSMQERFVKPFPSNKIVEEILNSEREKALMFISEYGGKVFNSYESIVSSSEIDAIYIPLPPALHFQWAALALRYGKHVLVEKPATISNDDTKDLICLAKNNKLAIHENYMFIFHNQIAQVDRLISDNTLGELRLIRISFGFPRRSPSDFRYNRNLGGGALFDAGGYVIKYAHYLLGDTARIKQAMMNYTKGDEVDIYGSGVMINEEGLTAQFSFGMDNDYKCELELWGSKGTFKTNRILTAPLGFIPSGVISINGKQEVIQLNADDSFYKSLDWFRRCILDETIREDNYNSIQHQAFLVEEFKQLAQKGD